MYIYNIQIIYYVYIIHNMHMCTEQHIYLWYSRRKNSTPTRTFLLLQS